jgi:drug/metabolite transporter (DMT)-like permease
MNAATQQTKHPDRSSAGPRPLVPRTRRWGIALAAVTAVISGFAVYVNGFGVRAWRDAGTSTATYTTVKNLVAAALLLGLMALATRRRPAEGWTRPTTRRQRLGLLFLGIVGGSIPFLLFFEGLARASSGQAAFIHKTLVIWVAILAVPLLKEHLGWLHLGAIGLLVAGQYLLIGGIGELSWGTGELMILAATLLWSVEVIVAKRLLGNLSPLTAGSARLGIGVGVLLAYALVTGAFTELSALGGRGWLIVLGTGAVLAGFVASWYSALARAQAVDVTAVLVVGAVITAVLRYGIDGASLPSTAGLVLVALGGAVAVAAGLRSRSPGWR